MATINGNKALLFYLRDFGELGANLPALFNILIMKRLLFNSFALLPVWLANMHIVF